MWGCVHILRMLISLLTFSAISMCLIFPLFKILTATFCPVIIWCATGKMIEKDTRVSILISNSYISNLYWFWLKWRHYIIISALTFHFTKSPYSKSLLNTILPQNNRYIVHYLGWDKILVQEIWIKFDRMDWSPLFCATTTLGNNRTAVKVSTYTGTD